MGQNHTYSAVHLAMKKGYFSKLAGELGLEEVTSRGRRPSTQEDADPFARQRANIVFEVTCIDSAAKNICEIPKNGKAKSSEASIMA